MLISIFAILDFARFVSNFINQCEDCNSLDAFDDDDILSIFTNQIGNESLSDLMMAEFSKMATINVKKLAQDFAKHDERFGNYPVA